MFKTVGDISHSDHRISVVSRKRWKDLRLTHSGPRRQPQRRTEPGCPKRPRKSSLCCSVPRRMRKVAGKHIKCLFLASSFHSKHLFGLSSFWFSLISTDLLIFGLFCYLDLVDSGAQKLWFAECRLNEGDPKKDSSTPSFSFFLSHLSINPN